MRLPFLRTLIALCLFMMLTLVLKPTVEAGGGPNGILRRMETMVSQLERSGEMDKDEATQMRQQIKTLRNHVEQRVEENGGWLNTQHDQDIYAEMDRYNKPLFQRYQNSKAKKTNTSETLGISPNNKNYRNQYPR